MARHSGFANEPLTDMLAIGAVSPSSARIWIRSESPGPIRLRYWPAAEPGKLEEVSIESGAAESDRTLCTTIPDRTRSPLEASTRYRVEAVHADSGRVIGSGKLETSPADVRSADDRFAIAWMSCNQPFTDDGRETAHGREMLAAAAACLENHSVKLVFTLGDQMYADYPPGLSLFDRRHFEQVRPRPDQAEVLDASIEEIRALLHERYRHFWNIDGWKRMHAEFPCYPAIDDHEIVDNWGCNPDHTNERWQRYLAAASAAYYDYQGSRILPQDRNPDSLDYELEYGPLAGYVFDLRSNRRTGDSARILSDTQFAQFARFLDAQAGKDVLILGLSVPIVHLPRWAARLGRFLTMQANEDFSDRWSTAGHKRDRDRILSMLRTHQRANPSQRVFCLSGDIHIACAHRILWDDGTPPIVQLVSSGITHHASKLTQVASKLSILANRRIDIDEDGKVGARVRLIAGESPSASNPYTELNLGILELERNGDGRFRTRTSIYGRRGDQPHLAFRTAWSGPPA